MSMARPTKVKPFANIDRRTEGMYKYMSSMKASAAVSAQRERIISWPRFVPERRKGKL
jgi:hypothetical protein